MQCERYYHKTGRLSLNGLQAVSSYWSPYDGLLLDKKTVQNLA